MQNRSNHQLDDSIEHGLRYDSVVSPAQKERAWANLRAKAEAQIASKHSAQAALMAAEMPQAVLNNGAAVSEAPTAKTETATHAVVHHPVVTRAVVVPPSAMPAPRTADLTKRYDPLLDSTPCCGDAAKENILLSVWRRFNEHLEDSARFLFSDEVMLERAHQNKFTVHHQRHQLMLMGSWMLTSA